MNIKKICTLLTFTLLFLSLFVSLASAEFIVNTVSTSDNLNNDNSINTISSSNTIESSNIEVYYIGTNSQFSASVQKNVQICKCDSVISYLSISNLDSYPSKYFISTDETFITLSETNLILNPGETKRIPVHYTASCNAIFNKNIEFKITNTNGNTEILEQRVLFQDCQNLEVALENLENNVLRPCGSKTFSVKVSNTGSFSETYQITVNKDVSEYVASSKNSFSLGPHKSEIISFNFSGDCSLYGDFNVDITVRAINNNKVATVTQPIKILQDYNYDFVFSEEEFNVCQNEITTKYLQIENYDSFANEFIFEIKSPSFIKFNFPLDENEKMTKSVIVSSTSKTTIPIEIDTNKIKEKNYEIIVIAKSVKGDIEIKKTIPVNVQNCYDFSMDILSNKLYRCGKDAYQTQSLLVKNEGVKDTYVGFVYYGPDFGSISSEEVFILANNHENYVNIVFENIDNEKRYYPITVEMYHKGEVVGLDTFDLIIDEAEVCYNIKTSKENIKVTPDKTNFSIDLKNIGTRFGVYTINVLNSEDYISLVTNNLELGKTQSKEILFELDSDELNNYAQEYNNNSLIGLKSNVTLLITHVDSQTQFIKELNFEIVNYPWYKRLWTYIYYLPTCLLIFSILILALVFSIIIFLYKLFTRKQSRNFKSHNLILILAIIILLISGTIIFSMFKLPMSPRLQKSSELNIFMYDNEIKTLDMDNYFIDPDGDELFFMVETNDENNVTYIFNETKLEIIPNENWVGNFSFILSAIDTHGASVRGEQINVFMTEKLKFNTYSEMFSAWCPFLNLTLLFLFLLFVWLANSVRKKKSNEEIKQEKIKAERLAKKEEKEKLKEAKLKETNKTKSKKVVKKTNKSETNKKVTNKSNKKATNKTTNKKTANKTTNNKKNKKVKSKTQKQTKKSKQ